MPITPAQIDIIKATVPILKTGGEALTTHFYKMMFAEYPSVHPLFNSANQHTGRQPRALAASVLAYAENIDALENIGPVAAQIVNKHVALQVLPEHYPIVGSCLLRSIREVLGADVATDAVIEAWGAAYGQLADILIAAEGAAYTEAAAKKGGWSGAREFTVVKKVKETDSITSFYLEPAADGANKDVIEYQPGQYLGLQMFVGADKKEIRRNYSLSQAADGKSLRITVKREAGGVASNYLHDEVAEGATLNVFPPAGCFTLDTAAIARRSVILLSAGVGITPTMAMLQRLDRLLSAHGCPSAAAMQPASVQFVHYAHSAAHRPFAADVELIAGKHSGVVSKHYVDAVGSSDATAVDASIDRWFSAPAADAPIVYLLGPTGFMRAMKTGLEKRGVPSDKIVYEFFGPAEALA